MHHFTNTSMIVRIRSRCLRGFGVNPLPCHEIGHGDTSGKHPDTHLPGPWLRTLFLNYAKGIRSTIRSDFPFTPKFSTELSLPQNREGSLESQPQSEMWEPTED